MIRASAETKQKVEETGKPVRIIGFFPMDPANDTTARLLKEWKDKFVTMSEKSRNTIKDQLGWIESPLDKEGLKRYEIFCDKCGERQGFLFAKTDNLKDWCDFHYTQWSDGEQWYGCLTPSVSPIDGRITFECACGNDTRDFRANMTMDSVKADQLEHRNKVGRDFGKKDSKFKAKQVTGTLKV